MDDDVINVKNQYYILSTSSLADDRTRVLKQGDTFAVYDRRGDIEPVGQLTQGLYHQETRFLSRWVLRVGKERPMLLSSAVRKDNALLAVDVTNPDIHKNDEVIIPRGSVHISRYRFLWQGTQYESLRMMNYSLKPVQLSLVIQYGADFADIFEVRGTQRKRRGELLETKVESGCVTLPYRGLDGLLRRCRIECLPAPVRTTASEMELRVSLQPHGEQTYLLTACCEAGNEEIRPDDFAGAFIHAADSIHEGRDQETHVRTSNGELNDWLTRSAADIHMMMTDTPHGRYPYAGVPWFSTPFGRDGIITGMETLWINPPLAHGVLSYLAATQATACIPEADAEPGKILHEARKGEMAALGEVPFKRYYGSVDSTPLFVMLAGQYFRRTGDRDFIQSIWPNVKRALEWIDQYGDADGDGFVEYARRSPTGLVQQGWKDSNDSVFHENGELAEGPIALCEVQGYVYAAKKEAAEIARALGFADQARLLSQQAAKLRERFESAFWCEELGTFVLALDGHKQPCKVRTTNAGHCLFSGIASQKHAERVAETLLDRDSFSGWGMRTVASRQSRFNPMSYHNGSIWPHDNAMVASGMARYGLKPYAARVLASLLDASNFMDLHRLPELFCGFNRRAGEGPTRYPVACSPQSWAAASVFMLMEACLGISIQGRQPQVTLTQTFLPAAVDHITIDCLRIGDACVTLAIQRYKDGAEVRVSRLQGEIEVVSSGGVKVIQSRAHATR